MDVTLVLNGETTSSTVAKGTVVKGILLIEPVQINSTFASGMHSVCENIDTDNDGHQDCYDQFPNNPDRWFDYGDESNNTPEVIDNNRFVADIYIKPARSINFITLNFTAVRTGVSFNEVVGA